MIRITDWRIEEMTGYKPISTFYTDFSIAEHLGVSAIRDTYKWAMEWECDYKMLTELVMVLNWKIWEHYESNEPLAKLYNELWETAVARALGILKGEELSYFYRTTD